MFKEMKKQNKMQAIFCSAVKPMKHLEISLWSCKHIWEKHTGETERPEKIPESSPASEVKWMQKNPSSHPHYFPVSF